MPKYSKDELVEILQRDRTQTKESLQTVEEALKTLKHPQHIERWKGYKENLIEHLEKIESSLKKLTGSQQIL